MARAQREFQAGAQCVCDGLRTTLGSVLTLLLASCLTASPPAKDLTADLSALLGITYVNDEVRDEAGRWTVFEHPETTAPSPGLNCSGFVVTSARVLFGRSPTLSEVTHDRLGDSGEGAAFGKDWDFGFDLVLNLSEGLTRTALLPEKDQAVDGLDGTTLRGFPIDDVGAWAKVFPRIKVGHVYLASLSRHFGKGLQHHHVALVLRDSADRVWFYQTLPKGHSHRVEISSPKGFERLQKMFGHGIHLLLIDVQPP
jgi:hypothetical protein